MSDVATQEITETTTVNEQVAKSLWDETPVANPNTQEPAAAAAPPAENAVPEPPKEEEAVYDVDEYFKTHFGVDAATAKTKWEELNKPQEPAAAQEPEWANEDSKKFFQLLKEGKTDEVYGYLDRQRQLQKLEQYDINNVSQAAELIKANLQFKHPELNAQQIDRMFARQYTMPEKPVQLVDQDDADYAIELEGWKRQVQDKEQDMIIDATLAKPELIKYKSQIVLPDIPEKTVAQQGPDQKELEAQAAKNRELFVSNLNNSYQNFKGFSVTAVDGEVQLPISYAISPEELNASKETVANFNLNSFFEQRWFDQQGSANITQIQEDLYLLMNRDKVFQKIANEAAAQRFLHQQKVQNNINLNSVNRNLTPPQQSTKTEEQALAEAAWAI